MYDNKIMHFGTKNGLTYHPDKAKREIGDRDT
jgi:hypothetical protein